MSYFSDLRKGITSSVLGLKLTLKHIFAARNSRGNFGIKDKKYFELKEGHVTLQYPHQTITVPETGRYQLDCEIDDCIVCDKCAKICPVDCIEIEAIKSPELIRTTSDGSPVRLHAAKFDIDLAKCCFCGLCTTVCPTECLTMNSEYDYSVSDVNLLNFAFSNLSADEAEEKRKLYEQFVAEKEAAKNNSAASQVEKPAIPSGFKPKFQPKAVGITDSKTEGNENTEVKKAFFPKAKIPTENKGEKAEGNAEESDKKPFLPTGSAFKPKLKEVLPGKVENLAVPTENGYVPKFKPSAVSEEKNNAEPLAKPAAKPIFKPKLREEAASEIKNSDTEPIEKPSGKPVFKPKMAPSTLNNATDAEAGKFIPKMKNISAQVEEIVEKAERPKFVPKLKPKE